MCVKIEDSPKGAWVYSRVGNKSSIYELEKQKDELIAFGKAKGYKIIGASQDIGSGLDYDRKGLKKMIEATYSGDVGIVLVKGLSRIGRDLLKTYEVLELLKPNIDAIISPTEGVMRISTMLTSFNALMGAMKYDEDYNVEDFFEQDELEQEDDENSQEI